MLRIATIHYPALGFEGDGMALVVYFQGCHNRCEGCHNESLQPFEGGMLLEPDELIMDVVQYDHKWVDSIVISGGEPLHQDINDLMVFLHRLQEKMLKPVFSFPDHL